MSNLSPEKRNQLLVVWLIGVGAIGLLWFGGVGQLQARLGVAQRKLNTAELQLRQAKTQVQEEQAYRRMAEVRQAQLDLLEDTMSGADPLHWMLNRGYILRSQMNTLHPLTDGSKRDLKRLMQEPPGDVEFEAPPTLPYPLKEFVLSGEGYYHDIGLFTAGLENTSPFIRLRKMTIQAAGPGLMKDPDEPELLQFRIEFTTCVNTNVPPASAADPEAE